MRLKYKFHFQPVGKTYVGVVVGEDARHFNKMIQLNEVGHDIVSMMNEETDRDSIVEKIQSQYDVDIATVGKYVDEIIDYLTKEGVLV